MGRIVILDDITAGRIAAGEVVERPASVVKELVENALDAGATRIEVALEDGGRALVRVADNGEGMAPEDAGTAFERHATSKLRQAEDLDRLTSFGFRGEALPSIGAVSRLRLLTCPPEATAGTEVVYEGGTLLSHRPGAARPGTTVWVRDLFFNTPARREAMRSAAAETARAAEVLATLALAAPRVALQIVIDGREAWSTPGSGSLRDAVASIFGAGQVRESAPIEWEGSGVRVTGLAGLPAAARRDGKRQYLVCNGRPINPHLMCKAVDEAYRGLLEVGRTPVFVIELTLPPETVDVNIHPAKTYVRFRDHGLVHRAVLVALRQALAGSDLFDGRLAGLGHPRPGASADAGATSRGPVGGWPLFAAEAAASSALGPQVATDPDGLPARLEPLGQLGGLFIIARSADALYLVDQHAAHERVIYDRLLREVEGADGAQPAQVLAVGETLELGPGEADLLHRRLGSLRRMGFEIEPFGGRTALIRAVPAVLAGAPAARLLGDFLVQLAEDGGRGGPAALGELTHTVRVMAACRAALKGGESLGREEMHRLLEDLRASAEPRTCPHGRPTFLRYRLGDLRRAFGRSADPGGGGDR